MKINILKLIAGFSAALLIPDFGVELYAGTLTFNNKVAYPVGNSPSKLELSDVNLDGRPDIVVANYNANTVSVLISNSNGSLRLKVDYPTGTNPYGVALGDVNGDGKADIVTANSADGTISVLLGKGSNIFKPKVDYPAGSRPYVVRLGDVNGDGKLDVVATNLSQNISVLLGNGNGTFKPAVAVQTGTTSPSEEALGDVNGDGKLDIVVAHYDSNAISVLLGMGDGTFKPKVDYPTGSGPSNVEVGDVNRDGKLDIVSTNALDSTISVLLGNGKGGFKPKVDYPVTNGTTIQAEKLADVNDDGKLDVVIASGDNNVSVLLGNGNGSFKPKVDYATGSNPYGVALGDVNGDGKLDIVTSDFGSGTVSVLLNKTSFAPIGAFKPKMDLQLYSWTEGLAFGDINRDGKQDIVTINHLDTSISVLLGNGNGTFKPSYDYPVDYAPIQVALHDINGDGKLDALTTNTNRTVSVLLGNGNGAFNPKVDYPVCSPSLSNCAGSMKLGDVNSDGKPDIIVTYTVGDTVSILLGKGDGTFKPKVDYPTGRFPTEVALADLNNDGKLDITVTNYSYPAVNPPTVSILFGKGNGTFKPKVDYPTPINQMVKIGDINGDGKLDIVAKESDGTSNTIRILHNNSDGTFLTSTTNLSITSRFFELGDVNGDGKLDLVVTNGDGAAAGGVTVLLGIGNGTFKPEATYITAPYLSYVALHDLNGDGKLDIIVGATIGKAAGVINVFLNSGAP